MWIVVRGNDYLTKSFTENIITCVDGVLMQKEMHAHTAIISHKQLLMNSDYAVCRRNNNFVIRKYLCIILLLMEAY